MEGATMQSWQRGGAFTRRMNNTGLHSEAVGDVGRSDARRGCHGSRPGSAIGGDRTGCALSGTALTSEQTIFPQRSQPSVTSSYRETDEHRRVRPSRPSSALAAGSASRSAYQSAKTLQISASRAPVPRRRAVTDDLGAARLSLLRASGSRSDLSDIASAARPVSARGRAHGGSDPQAAVRGEWFQGEAMLKVQEHLRRLALLSTADADPSGQAPKQAGAARSLPARPATASPSGRSTAHKLLAEDPSVQHPAAHADPLPTATAGCTDPQELLVAAPTHDEPELASRTMDASKVAVHSRGSPKVGVPAALAAGGTGAAPLQSPASVAPRLSAWDELQRSFAASTEASDRQGTPASLHSPYTPVQHLVSKPAATAAQKPRTPTAETSRPLSAQALTAASPTASKAPVAVPSPQRPVPSLQLASHPPRPKQHAWACISSVTGINDPSPVFAASLKHLQPKHAAAPSAAAPLADPPSMPVPRLMPARPPPPPPTTQPHQYAEESCSSGGLGPDHCTRAGASYASHEEPTVDLPRSEAPSLSTSVEACVSAPPSPQVHAVVDGVHPWAGDASAVPKGEGEPLLVIDRMAQRIQRHHRGRSRGLKAEVERETFSKSRAPRNTTAGSTELATSEARHVGIDEPSTQARCTTETPLSASTAAQVLQNAWRKLQARKMSPSPPCPVAVEAEACALLQRLWRRRALRAAQQRRLSAGRRVSAASRRFLARRNRWEQEPLADIGATDGPADASEVRISDASVGGEGDDDALTETTSASKHTEHHVEATLVVAGTHQDATKWVDKLVLGRQRQEGVAAGSAPCEDEIENGVRLCQVEEQHIASTLPPSSPAAMAITASGDSVLSPATDDAASVTQQQPASVSIADGQLAVVDGTSTLAEMAPRPPERTLATDVGKDGGASSKSEAVGLVCPVAAGTTPAAAASSADAATQDTTPSSVPGRHYFRPQVAQAVHRMALVCDYCATDIQPLQVYWHCSKCHETHRFERDGGCDICVSCFKRRVHEHHCELSTSELLHRRKLLSERVAAAAARHPNALKPSYVRPFSAPPKSTPPHPTRVSAAAANSSAGVSVSEDSNAARSFVQRLRDKTPHVYEGVVEDSLAAARRQELLRTLLGSEAAGARSTPGSCGASGSIAITSKAARHWPSYLAAAGTHELASPAITAVTPDRGVMHRTSHSSVRNAQDGGRVAREAGGGRTRPATAFSAACGAATAYGSRARGGTGGGAAPSKGTRRCNPSRYDAG